MDGVLFFSFILAVQTFHPVIFEVREIVRKLWHYNLIKLQTKSSVEEKEKEEDYCACARRRPCC